jgi:hypothetical protein
LSASVRHTEFDRSEVASVDLPDARTTTPHVDRWIAEYTD